MLLQPLSWIDIFATHARAQQVCIEVQHTRQLAAQTRYRARLTYLARYMPQANLLTRAITTEILTRYGLLAPAPTDRGLVAAPSVSNRSQAIRP
jgi:hypothetical protein